MLFFCSGHGDIFWVVVTQFTDCHALIYFVFLLWIILIQCTTRYYLKEDLDLFFFLFSSGYTDTVYWYSYLFCFLFRVWWHACFDLYCPFLFRVWWHSLLIVVLWFFLFGVQWHDNVNSLHCQILSQRRNCMHWYSCLDLFFPFLIIVLRFTLFFCLGYGDMKIQIQQCKSNTPLDIISNKKPHVLIFCASNYFIPCLFQVCWHGLLIFMFRLILFFLFRVWWHACLDLFCPFLSRLS